MEEQANHLIVVVDDDESVREATVGLLRSNRYRAEAFASAELFLNSPFSGSAQCLLLDFRLPRMNGLELQCQLATSGSPVPIIFISACDQPEVRRQALRKGAAAFLAKPFSESGLLNALQNALSLTPK